MCDNRRSCCRGDGVRRCRDNIKKKCREISQEDKSEIKKIAKFMILCGVMAILVLCFPPVVWFVLMALGMIALGIKIFRL